MAVHLVPRRTPFVLLLVLLVLLFGLGAGLARALGASASPSRISGQVVLRVGYVGEPDNLNPFIGQVSRSALALGDPNL